MVARLYSAHEVVHLRVLSDTESVRLREVPEGRRAVLQLPGVVVVLHVEVDKSIVTEVHAVPATAVEATHVDAAAVALVVAKVGPLAEAKDLQYAVKLRSGGWERHLGERGESRCIILIFFSKFNFVYFFYQ